MATHNMLLHGPETSKAPFFARHSPIRMNMFVPMPPRTSSARSMPAGEAQLFEGNRVRCLRT